MGKPLYTDGSAKHVGTPWAAGASAVVQYDEQGNEQAWTLTLPKGFPISAVATEHMVVVLCVIVEYEAQTGRCIVNPVCEVLEANVDRTEHQTVEDKARWASQ